MKLEPSHATKIKVHSRFIPKEKQLRAIGLFMLQQVKQRFITQGASGGVHWPKKRSKDWGYDDGRKPLQGHGGLRKSFQYRILREGQTIVIEVYSDSFFAKMHQLGTVSKGGVLPDIVAKKAKALFIPITDLAKSSQRISGKAAAAVRNIYGMSKLSGPIRMATRGKKISNSMYGALRPGKLVDGKLHVRNADGEWVPGVPDFIFLKRVSLPPRPMLPNSPRERQDQKDFVRTAFK